MREFTRRAGEALAARLALAFDAAAAACLFLLPLLGLASAGNGTALSMVRNRCLQHGHLFSVLAHLSIQSKQNLCVHPLMVATSFIVAGASRQMAQVKSSGGFCEPSPLLAEEAAMLATPFIATAFFAAGFKFISSISSSPLLKTMALSLEEPCCCDAADAAVLALPGLIVGEEEAATLDTGITRRLGQR